MNFLSYQKEGKRKMLNINLVKEIYTKEINENIELWCDEQRIHSVNKEMLEKYIKKFAESKNGKIILFDERNELFQNISSNNMKILREMDIDEFLNSFEKITVDNLYWLFKEFYPLALIRMTPLDLIIPNFLEYEIEESIGLFLLENLIVINHTKLNKSLKE